MTDIDRRTAIAATLAAAVLARPGLAQTVGRSMKPPVARATDHSFTLHGITVRDPYHWLRDPDYPKVDDPEILAYLNAENAWFEAGMKPQAALVETLFQELRGRVKEDDASVPFPKGGFLYGNAFAKGAQYRVWSRTPKAGGPAQEVLSEPALAEGKKYFRLAAFSPSPDGRLLAYSYDDSGDERFTLRVRDMETGRDLETVAEDSVGDVAWSADGRALAWAQASAEWRPNRARLHRIGGATGNDPILYEEAGTHWVGVTNSQDGRWILISASENTVSEWRIVDAAKLDAPRLVRPRKAGVKYDIDARGDTLFVLTNDDHVNFRVATARADRPAEWTTLIAGSDRHYLRGITAFASYLAITERRDGLDQVRLRFNDGRERYVRFPEASYTASLGTNAEADAPLLRLGYASMVTPQTVYDYDVAADRLITRKVQEIPSGYDPSQYATERLTATARDGTKVPVSVVYKKGYPKNGTRPLHVYGYGSYGYAVPPGFSASRLSLLDRGFAFAIAHIRGGDDLGYQWYLDGKLDRKVNSFNDFIDVTKHLHAQGFARPGLTSASGGSAGGWLMGYVATVEPALWGAIAAHVPFVDIVNTMMDTTLPLTPGEFPEWGNPRDSRAVLERLIALSPYEQVRAQAYPPMLVTGGLNDPRVTYWEPAKWVARLRATATGTAPLLMKINMGAGHGGKSGRFEALRETAEEYAFVLTQLEAAMKRSRA